MWLFAPLLSSGCAPLPTDCADPVPVFADNDGDGFGRVPLGEACTVDAGRSTDPSDCNDSRAEVFPGAPEVCDGLDNDCDGSIDEELAQGVYHADLDGDGYGDDRTSFATCQVPGGTWTPDGGDCDDDDALISPASDEDCANTLDDDCDQLADCEDPDCDGAAACLWPCADAVLSATLPHTVGGSTVGARNDWEASCVESASPDVTYQFTAPASGTFVFDTFGSAIDTVLHAYDGCDGEELDCSDDLGGAYVSEIELDLSAGEVVVVVVDGFFDSTEGAYVLNVREL